MDTLHQKYEALKDFFRSYGSAAVAFSGGVDSALLLAAAQEALGSHVCAVTAVSRSFPCWERQEAEQLCASLGVKHILCTTDELSLEAFQKNPPDRCYHCKKYIFSQITAIAAENNCAVICEGSNMDDLGDYRPGMQAIRELGIRSPLKEAGLYKEEIRQLSRELGLPTWKKPSYACLASRFPYGEAITEEKLRRVELAETFLMERGFCQVRVRSHGDLARVELPSEDFPRFMEESVRLEAARRFKEIGFAYTSLDLIGFRSGSMNEVLNLSGK